jgi:hypothetical protein
VALALAVVVPGGCLWAPDIHEEPEGSGRAGATVDRDKVVPRLDDVTLEFQGTITFDVSGAITHPTVPADQLWYHWFVNYAWQDDKNKLPPYMQERGQSSIILNPCTPRVKTWGVTPDAPTAVEVFVTETYEIGDTSVVVVESPGDDGLMKRIITGPYAYVAWWLEPSGIPCPEP